MFMYEIYYNILYIIHITNVSNIQISRGGIYHSTCWFLTQSEVNKNDVKKLGSSDVTANQMWSKDFFL